MDVTPQVASTPATSLPAPLSRLRDIAYNLRWAWDHDTRELFVRLDSEAWERSRHNPVLMLTMVTQERVDAAASDPEFLAHLDRVARGLEAYMTSEDTWFRRRYGSVEGTLAAYISAEFGLAESLMIFAGGLGVLAGDHLKSASDLGVPLVGVGLMYQYGYFRQSLTETGWQQEQYDANDFERLPLELERRADGSPLTVEVPFPGRPVHAQVWRAQVGRVPLYLLDTNVPLNSEQADRDITDQLYGGDIEMRIKQEIVLGIGAYRALEALGIQPRVYHMNEGHSAFVSLELTRKLMETRGLSFGEACDAAIRKLVFTTHTPVPAGHDYFPPELFDRYFREYTAGLGLATWELLGLGRQNAYNPEEYFCMTVLGIRMAAHSNAVSRLHGEVTRDMWHGLWPELPMKEVPITHVTNGVHLCSWVAPEMDALYTRHSGPSCDEEPTNESVWQAVETIPAEELWRTHEHRRSQLIEFARRRLQTQLARREESPEAAREMLQPTALTIGFARRFATYKRATLLLRDPDRLARILSDPDRPVQVIFAGKAHPHDEGGKELIRRIVELSRREEFQGRLLFLEDYDMDVARNLVQGADVWLNNPIRPQEASGTSGMKAAANGVLNVSTLDGWWDEAWAMARREAAPIGWVIGDGRTYEDQDYQERVESEALYRLLEEEVVPTFYNRDERGIPREWVRRMKASICTLSHFFNTDRMVQEYTERFYGPAAGL